MPYYNLRSPEDQKHAEWRRCYLSPEAVQFLGDESLRDALERQQELKGQFAILPLVYESGELSHTIRLPVDRSQNWASVDIAS